MRKHLPPVNAFLKKTIPRFPNYTIEEHVASGNNGHLFRAFDPSTRSNLAFKVVPVENLPEDDGEQQAYLIEARKANLLDHQSVIKYIDVFYYNEVSTGITCVFFVCNYIDGLDLAKYMKRNREEINLPFIEAFMNTMFELLYELEQRRFHHGDLHTGNILVATPPFDIYQRPTFRVTDFGVGEATGHASHANDYLQLAHILKQLLERIQYANCGGRDRYVYDVLRKEFLARHLIETDGSADPLASNPRGLLERLNSIDAAYSSAKRMSVTKLTSPFDYPNCEQIGNSHLLLKNLYSDRLLGLSEIHNRSNLILTGPRGCGKTTVFRALSLEYLTSTDNDNPDDLTYIGFYYRCDDLYFAFPRYRIPNRNDALDIPMHFLTVTLLAIALEQLAIWAQKYFRTEWERKEGDLVSGLWRLFGWRSPDSPAASRLSTLVARLRGKERKRAARKQRFVHIEQVDGYFGPDKMFEACRLLRSSLSFLRGRHLYFFVDDYSHPKITKELQANLNRLVMHRNEDVFFKLSTESPISFAREDVDGKRYVESREYDLLNLGLRYIASDPKQILEFLEDLFARRFREVENYPVATLKQLVGSIRRNENATARAFRLGRGHKNYSAVETIAAMCSGDIHYMIRLVSRMVEDFGGEAVLASTEAEPRIPHRDQHKSIRAAAGSFMESVRTLPQHGQKLADIVSAFGNVAHSYLRYKNSSNNTGNPPHQASRIEPYESLRINSEAQTILDELLRYSILIEDPRGKSRRGKVVPRFYLRRYLVPHFRLTFSRRDSLPLENRDVEMLLLEPQRFENRWRLTSEDDAPRVRNVNPRQGDLFSDER